MARICVTAAVRCSAVAVGSVRLMGSISTAAAANERSCASVYVPIVGAGAGCAGGVACACCDGAGVVVVVVVVVLVVADVLASVRVLSLPAHAPSSETAATVTSH